MKLYKKEICTKFHIIPWTSVSYSNVQHVVFVKLSTSELNCSINALSIIFHVIIQVIPELERNKACLQKLIVNGSIVKSTLSMI